MCNHIGAVHKHKIEFQLNFLCDLDRKTFVNVTQDLKTATVHAWQKYVLISLQHLCFVKRSVLRHNLQQQSISFNMLILYILELFWRMNERIADLLSDSFAVISKGQTYDFA